MKKFLFILLMFSQLDIQSGCGCASTTSSCSSGRCGENNSCGSCSNSGTSTSARTTQTQTVSESPARIKLKNRITKLNERLQNAKKNNRKIQLTKIQKRLTHLNAKLVATR